MPMALIRKQWEGGSGHVGTSVYHIPKLKNPVGKQCSAKIILFGQFRHSEPLLPGNSGDFPKYNLLRSGKGQPCK